MLPVLTCVEVPFMCKSVQEALDKLYNIIDSLTEVVLVTLVCFH